MRGNDLPRIVDFVGRHRIPSIFELDRGVEGGGLMEFGSNRAELARDAVPYIDKIANGAKPADLPVEEPTKFRLIINNRAAKALGLAIPPGILVRADEVIE
jgi:putative ABC transport system substrate-binding protein